jgi:hypothetical protein
MSGKKNTAGMSKAPDRESIIPAQETGRDGCKPLHPGRTLQANDAARSDQKINQGDCK